MRRAGKLIIFLGIFLILVSLVILVSLHVSTYRGELEVSEILTRLKDLLPPESVGMPEERYSVEMPVLEIGGKDIIALLGIPSSNIELPVVSEWNRKTLISLPQRASGGVYDSSLVIGGYDREGQFDCLSKLDVGNEIFVTDMMGAKFSYTVSEIQRKKFIEEEVLYNSDSALTLFVRDLDTMEYIVVYCIYH
ncbi:MAG: sortase [Clostridia bacterium]|nr:sortase [Clostridia bacterium]